jgi:hypothetical protein
LIFGDSRKGWPSCSGRSSIQTFSSFCHIVSGPSMRRASLTTVAKGAGPPAVAGGAGAAAPLRAEAVVAAGRAPAGVAQPAATGDAACTAGAPAVGPGAVAHPASSAAA